MSLRETRKEIALATTIDELLSIALREVNQTNQVVDDLEGDAEQEEVVWAIIRNLIARVYSLELQVAKLNAIDDGGSETGSDITPTCGSTESEISRGGGVC